MNARPRRLQRRLMLAFAGFTLFVAGLFAFYALAFVYSTEDAFFEAMLDQEAALQLREHAASGGWARPHAAWMSVHADPSSFPADLGERFAAEPQRVEFPGSERRHYHIRAIVPPAPAQPAWLVAEVSRQLVVRPMQDKIVRLLAGSGLAIVALALLLGYWLARRTAAPLERLAGRIDGMSPERLPDDIAQDYPDDEVGVLARGLESLARRVNAFVAREQEFTRDASHELRTPLAVILGAAERLMVEPRLSDAGRRHLLHIRQSVVQLEQTVATLLTLAREEHLDTGGEPVPVLPVLERVIVEQAPLLDGKPVEVVVEVTREARVALPAPVLRILLSNLVGNGFSHTQVGEVRIDVRQGRLRIANSADASEPASRWREPRAFSKRAGSSGFGLGLSIVRRLGERYHLGLQVEEADGFVVASIPLAGAETPASGAGDHRQSARPS